MIRRIFFVPPGPDKMRGLFASPSSPLDASFVSFFSEKGVELKTVADWDPAAHRPDDLLVVLNHPYEGRLMGFFYALKYRGRANKKFAVSKKTLDALLAKFTKKILFQIEPPIVMPYPYRHLAKLRRMYAKVFTIVDFKDPGIGHFILPYLFKDKEKKFFGAPKDKFLTIINSNARPHGFWSRELYSERLRAIRHFSAAPDFDLYGNRWDKKPFLHWPYAPYARRAWRGRIGGQEIEDKLPTLARYKFTVLFENSVFPGYVDIKFLDAFVTGTVPVYLGAPDVADYVPPECFIDMRDFKAEGGGYDYAKLEKFLRGMTEAERERYRRAMRDFLSSEKIKAFTPRRLAEVVLKAAREIEASQSQ